MLMVYSNLDFSKLIYLVYDTYYIIVVDGVTLTKQYSNLNDAIEYIESV